MSRDEHEHRHRRSAFTSTLIDELRLLQPAVSSSIYEYENETWNETGPMPHSRSHSESASDSKAMKIMKKIVTMIEEDSQRPINESLIGLNQTAVKQQLQSPIHSYLCTHPHLIVYT